MIDIDNLEEDIKNIVDTDSVEESTEFVLSPKQESTEVVVEQKSEVAEYVPSHDDFAEDFSYVRNNLRDIIGQGTVALQQALLLASTMENPRSYEVVATIMKTLSEVNKDLVSTHKAKDERTVNQPTHTQNIQNNTVFVGSTAEFSKLMKEKIKNK